MSVANMNKNVDYFTSEFEINDSPAGARKLLTKGFIQEEISRQSGARLSTRGRFQGRGCRGGPQGGGDRPLYLFIQGPTKHSIQLAIQKIHEIIGKEVGGGGGVGGGEGFSERMYIGLDAAPPSFNLPARVLGQGETNLQFIRSETGASVSLCGGQEVGGEPLYLLLQHPTREGLQAATLLAANLIDTLQQEVQQHQAPSPFVVQEAYQVPPPETAKPPPFYTTAPPAPFHQVKPPERHPEPNRIRRFDQAPAEANKHIAAVNQPTQGIRLMNPGVKRKRGFSGGPKEGGPALKGEMTRRKVEIMSNANPTTAGPQEASSVNPNFGGKNNWSNNQRSGEVENTNQQQVGDVGKVPYYLSPSPMLIIQNCEGGKPGGNVILQQSPLQQGVMLPATFMQHNNTKQVQMALVSQPGMILSGNINQPNNAESEVNYGIISNSLPQGTIALNSVQPGIILPHSGINLQNANQQPFIQNAQSVIIPQGNIQQRMVLQGNIQTGIFSQGSIQHGIISQSNVQQQMIQQGNIQHGIVPQGNIQHGIVAQNNIQQQGMFLQGNIQESMVQQGSNIQQGMVPQSNIQQEISQNNNQHGIHSQSNIQHQGIIPQGNIQQGNIRPGMAPQRNIQQEMNPQSNVQQGNMHKGMVPQGNLQGMIPPGNMQGMGPQGNIQQGMGPQGNMQQGMGPQGNMQQGMGPQGNTQQGMSPQGNMQQGVGPQGNMQQGMVAQGNVQQGIISQLNMPSGINPQETLQKAMVHQGNIQGIDPQGNIQGMIPQQGIIQQGNIQKGMMLQGNVQQGMILQGNMQQGMDPQGNVQQRIVPQGNIQLGMIPQGNIQHGMVPQSNVQSGMLPQNNMHQGGVPQGMPQGMMPQGMISQPGIISQVNMQPLVSEMPPPGMLLQMPNQYNMYSMQSPPNTEYPVPPPDINAPNAQNQRPQPYQATYSVWNNTGNINR